LHIKHLDEIEQFHKTSEVYVEVSFAWWLASIVVVGITFRGALLPNLVGL
jgi:hypothetical protein